MKCAGEKQCTDLSTRQEILKYKGQQVAPAELENVLFAHPRVHEAAVIGVPAPDDPGNDLLRAYVVVDDRDKVTAEEIAEYVRARVAPYKQLSRSQPC